MTRRPVDEIEKSGRIGVRIFLLGIHIEKTMTLWYNGTIP
jgi:hypothetical protein